jgi:preprotein translocase subunit SecD
MRISKFFHIGKWFAVKVVLRNDKDKQAAIDMVDDEFRKLDMKVDETQPVIYLSISEQEIKEIKKFALAQNITTLRNRVNELGVYAPRRVNLVLNTSARHGWIAASLESPALDSKQRYN